MAISILHNAQKRNIDSIKVRNENKVRSLLTIKVRVGDTIRVIWRKVKSLLGGLFIQNHSVTVQGYTINFNFKD